MVQYPQNNVIMKCTTRFIRFTGWIPLKYGSTTTPPIIAHCKKTPMSSIVFHIAIPQTSNIRRTTSFDLSQMNFQNESLLWDVPYIRDKTLSYLYFDTVPSKHLLIKIHISYFIHIKAYWRL